MPATPQYHVVVDSQGYLIDPASYRRRPLQPLAPKTRQGAEEYGDLVTGSVWAQSSWMGGFGYPEWDPAAKDHLGDGSSIDTHYGDLRPGRRADLVHNVDIWAMAVFKGVLYGIATTSGSIYSTTNGTTWNFVTNLNGISAVTSLRSIAVSTQGSTVAHLFVGAGDSGKIFKLDGTTGVWSLWATIEGASSIRALTDGQFTVPNGVGLGVLLIGASQCAFLSNGPAPYTGSSPATSLLVVLDPAGAWTGFAEQVPWPFVEAIKTWRNELYWGANDVATVNGLLSPRGALYLTTTSGTVIGGTGTTTRRVQLLDDNAVTAFEEYNQKLYAGSMSRGKIWTVDSNGLALAFNVPQLARTGAPPTYLQPIRTLVVDNDRLYVPILDAQGLCTYQADGTGWCRYATPGGASTAPRGMAAYGYDLFLGGTTGVYRLPPRYATGATAISCWFDAELASLDKGLSRVTIAHTPLLTGESIGVEYALDDAAGWTALGTSNVVGASTATFPFPPATHGLRYRFRYTFTLTTDTHGPQLRTTVVEYQLSAAVVAASGGGTSATDAHVKGEFVFDVLLEGTFDRPLRRLDNTDEPKTGLQLRKTLWASKAHAGSVTYQDVDGQTYAMTLAEIEDHLLRDKDVTRQGWRASVKLQEA